MQWPVDNIRQAKKRSEEINDAVEDALKKCQLARPWIIFGITQLLLQIDQFIAGARISVALRRRENRR